MRDWPSLHPSRERHVARLRLAGRIVLGLSACVAVFVYRIGGFAQSERVQDLLPLSARVIERQRGILFGRTGAALMGWFDALGEPAGQAILIAIVGVIGAAALYQVAHQIEVEEER